MGYQEKLYTHVSPLKVTVWSLFRPIHFRGA